MPRLLSFVLAAMWVAAASSASQAAQSTPIKFVMDWAWEGTQASWAVASESGCYAKAGLNVHTDRGYGSGDSISKVASGVYDIGVADFSSLVNYDSGHADDRLVAVFVISDQALTSAEGLKKAGIFKPKDLEGKRISAVQPDASHVLFPAFAKANGIDLNSIHWVIVAPNLRETTVYRGQADAAVGHMNSVVTGLHSLGMTDSELTIMPYADYGVRLYGNAIIVKPAWATAHAQAMRSFVKCAIAGIQGTISHPDDSVRLMTKFSSMVDVDKEIDALKFSTTRAVYTDDVKKNGLSDVTPKRLDQALTQISDAMGFKKPAPSDVWTPDYLPPRNDRMITP